MTRKTHIGVGMPNRVEEIERLGARKGPPYYSASPVITHLRSLHASGRRWDAFKWGVKIGSASGLLFLLRLPKRISDEWHKNKT
jgi:hypothetical protein